MTNPATFEGKRGPNVIHKIVQALNLEEGERTEKVIVVLLGNGAQEKEIQDYL